MTSSLETEKRPDAAPAAAGRPEPLFQGADWDYAKLRRVYDAIETVAVGEFGLDLYPNQVEVITAEQMLDAYSAVGLPLMYRHWSFGKHFATNEALYRKGLRGLAYEIVINSNPCISYIMEENSMAMQTLVLAHAAFGHNHFFKNNYTFKQWTDAESILDYLDFAKSYIARAEETHGARAVERVLDAAHALMNHGVHRYPRPRPLNLRRERERERERAQHAESTYNDLWRTVPRKERDERGDEDDTAERKRRLRLPEENILYFLEKVAPRLEPWQREILRIVRNLAQYFYPQKHTKVMNEGCATFCHYQIMNRLSADGLIPEGAMLEVLDSHTAVVRQPAFDERGFGGLNPYTLGFNVMRDIYRVCSDPTDEDRAWFPDIAGNRKPWPTLRQVWANYRDESFLLQHLSPRVIREMKLFTVRDDSEAPELVVTDIHDDAGYREIRRSLAHQHDVAAREPDIQVVDVDLAGDRRLILHHRVRDGVLLDRSDAVRVMRYIAELWSYPVRLIEVDATTDEVRREHADVEPGGT